MVFGDIFQLNLFNIRIVDHAMYSIKYSHFIPLVVLLRIDEKNHWTDEKNHWFKS